MNHHDIKTACRLLFSPDIEITPDYLSSLRLNVLQSAFRNKAFETHPDRAIALGISNDVLIRRFQDVSMAYESLLSYINNSMKSANSKQNTAVNENAAETDKKCRHKKKAGHAGDTKPEYFNSSHIPSGPLLFGQFLMYSGVISMKQLLDAVFWQRKQRPLYGEIALNWKMVTRRDLVNILKNRKPPERFGECALRLGVVTPFQNMAVLAKQINSQKRIGEYFVSRGVLSKTTVEKMNLLYKKHNYIYR